MKHKKIILLITMLLILTLSIGYSAFSKKLGIEDLTAIVRDQTDMRITSVQINQVTNDALSTYEEYDRDNISLGVNLPNENSTIKYKVTLTNYGNVYMLLDNITGISEYLEYTISNYSFGDVICDSLNSCNLGSSKDIYITIKYKESKYDEHNTIYSFVLDFEFIQLEKEYEFDYKGEEEVFIVPYDGYYKLETWGAQGGTGINISTNGYGGYSTGEIYLNKGEKIYINVGGTTTTIDGGYNGGGTGGRLKQYGCGGGGASHIAKKSGLLSSLENYLNSILIVSGGGGGSGVGSSEGISFMQNGGSGGGVIGVTGYDNSSYNKDDNHYWGTGGTQTTGGAAWRASKSEPESGTFGQGGNYIADYSVDYGGSGGGGGFYGGGGSSRGHGGGGGGSGYIGNENLTNKVMYCYDCQESTDINTKTINIMEYSQTPISTIPKQGAGYAKITYLGKKQEQIFDFVYTGSYQTFSAPTTGMYKIELWGASGGSASGGDGSYTAGMIPLDKSDKLYIYVGSQGESKETITNIGGYNGGGYSGNNPDTYSYGGGGATDVRLLPGEWNNFNSLKSRIMVAAGGAGGVSHWTNIHGGAAGGLVGYSGQSGYDKYNNSTYIPTGPSQISIGYSYNNIRNGDFGYSIQTNTTGWGGGGGSGYYSGGNGFGTTGAGGSSFISGHNGCDAIQEESTKDNIIHTGQSIHYSGKKFTNTLMIDGLGYQWTDVKRTEVVGMPMFDGSLSMTGNEGNGYARITYIGDAEQETVTINLSGDIDKELIIPKGKDLVYPLDKELYEFNVSSNKSYEITNKTLKISNVTTNTNIAVTEYIEADYLEGDGTSYIDTGYQPTSETKVVIDFQSTDVEANKYMALYGSRTGVKENSYTLFKISDSVYRYDFLECDDAFLFTATNISAHKLIQDKNNYLLDNEELTPREYQQFQTLYNLYLFSVNTEGRDAITAQGTTSYANYTGKIYSFKIYDQGTELVRDYVPVYTKSNQIAGMFDLVNHKFYSNQQNLTTYPDSKFTYGYEE